MTDIIEDLKGLEKVSGMMHMLVATIHFRMKKKKMLHLPLPDLDSTNFALIEELVRQLDQALGGGYSVGMGRSGKTLVLLVKKVNISQ